MPQRPFAALMLLCLAAGAASAQTTPDAPPQDKDKPTPDTKTTTVTVKGQKPLNRIDRQVYDNTKDPDSQTGTAADALNKVPGVSVDPQGNVTLRGRSPQILINGKPSPLMSGDNRAAALLAMPSGAISSIEIINNPGAQFGTDSSGAGIINIVTRKALPPGGMLSPTVQATSAGGASSTLFGQYHTGKFSFTGMLVLRDDPRDGNSGSAQHALDANGDVIRGTQSVSRQDATSHTLLSTGSLEYDLSAADSLSGQFSYMRNSSRNTGFGNDAVYDAGGTPSDLYSQASTGDGAFETQTLGADWDHTGQKPGETLKIDAQVSRTLNSSAASNLSLYSLSVLPANLPGQRTAFDFGTRADNERLGADYTTTLGDDQVNAGAQVVRDGSDARNASFGPAPASAAVLPENALFANQFIYSQVVSAAYLTYQKPFGAHWIVLGGLRAENFGLHADAATAHLTNRVGYTTYNPSLFATYVISDKAKVRLSYAHRLLRPSAQDYNPATVLTSETSISVGRPNLKPQRTDSFEAGYEYTDKGTSWSLRGYDTHEAGMIVWVSQFVPDPLNLGNLVTSTTRLNAGTRDTLGTEFVFSRKFSRQWSLNMNANLANVDYRTPNFRGNPSLTGLTGRASLSYTTKSRQDSIQVGYNVSPRLLTGQGYRSGFSAATINWSHNLTKTLVLVVGVNDLLRTSKITTVTDTTTYYGSFYRSLAAPVFTISLRTSFGSMFSMPKVAPPGVTIARN